jgi:hypothetical protein
MNKWQAIETAPKGVSILVATKYGVCAAEQDAKPLGWGWAVVGDKGEVMDNTKFGYSLHPIAWMPLPSLP